MRRFFRKNFVLMLGISLPLLLTLFFGMASLIPKLLVKPPKFDLLYTTLPYPHDDARFEVVHGKLKVFVSPQVKKGILPMPRLFRFDAKKQISIEIPIELPVTKNSHLSNREEIVIPELKHLTLDPKETSPDGYQVEFSIPQSNDGISLFLISSYKRSFLIRKKGNSLNITDENNSAYGYKSIKFLGWVIPNKE